MPSSGMVRLQLHNSSLRPALAIVSNRPNPLLHGGASDFSTCVIPVQTGIHTALNKAYYVYIPALNVTGIHVDRAFAIDLSNGGILWIPACAGMTAPDENATLFDCLVGSHQRRTPF